MSTMDIIQYKGLSRTSSTLGWRDPEQVAAAFRIITADDLVNIFGGIMKCDVIRGRIAAVKDVGLEVPLVCRLSGTNAELGKEVLKASGLAIIPATTTRRQMPSSAEG